MNFKQTLETIESSAVFKDFMQKNPNAELCAGFFIFDFLTNDIKKSLDYKTKEQDKIFTFDLDKNNEVVMKQDKLINDPRLPRLEKIKPETKIDLNEIPSIAQKQAEENNITAKFQKIIAVLQNHENQQIWNLTCMLDSFIILNILINSDTGETIKFDRKSMADFIKKK